MAAFAAMPKFRARPVDPRVMQSCGDLGVPRVVKTAPTVPEAPVLKVTARGAAARPGAVPRPVAGVALQHPLGFPLASPGGPPWTDASPFFPRSFRMPFAFLFPSGASRPSPTCAPPTSPPRVSRWPRPFLCPSVSRCTHPRVLLKERCLKRALLAPTNPPVPLHRDAFAAAYKECTFRPQTYGLRQE